MKKKTLALVLALTLLVAGVVGGTLAWLTDQTAEVKNTFTVGDINIGLTETTTDYKMVPGNTIAKDPTVTVKANSEACWLFVKVTESENLDTFITYAIAEGWTALLAWMAFTTVRFPPPPPTRPSPCWQAMPSP
ncbi:MAG: TasA family protein [Oscillospiraceae bacterium]